MAGHTASASKYYFADTAQANAAAIASGTAYAYTDLVGTGMLAVPTSEVAMADFGDIAQGAEDETQDLYGDISLTFPGTAQDERVTLTILDIRAATTGKITAEMATLAAELMDAAVGTNIDIVRVLGPKQTRLASGALPAVANWSLDDNSTATYLRGQIARRISTAPVNGRATFGLEITPSLWVQVAAA